MVEFTIEKLFKKLCFPRLSGSEEEKKAASYIELILKSNGYNVSREQFSVPSPQIRTFFSILWFLLLFVMSISLFFGNLLVSASTILIFLLMKKFDIHINLCLSKTKSENIFAFKNNKKKRTLLITAHYDTARVSHPFFQRISFLMAKISPFLNTSEYFTILFLFLIFINLNFHIVSAFNILFFLNLVLLLLAAIFSLLFILKIVKFFANKSEFSVGADDNASGVAISLSLSELFKRRRFNFNIGFLFLGCEENSQFGSREWISTHKNLSTTSLILNLDTLSRGEYFVLNEGWDYLFKVRSDAELLEKLESVMTEKKYFKSWDSGFRGDDYNFAKNNFRAIGIMRADREQLTLIKKIFFKIFGISINNKFALNVRWIHTEDDIYIKSSQEKLEESKNIVLKLIQELNNQTIPNATF